MWWTEVGNLSITAIQDNDGQVHKSALIEPGAILDDSLGPISIGAQSKICAGAIIRGPVIIKERCMIGNAALVRGPVLIGADVSIGYATEIKQARIADGVRIGPMCFVADSIVNEAAYLGAMVRTSNHRLDGQTISAFHDGKLISTGLEKLGCWIGTKTALGIQVIILPGRVVAAHSIFEPRITIERNYPEGRYRLTQNISKII